MTEQTASDLSWLAGLWDGEGSVGVTISHTANSIHIPCIQINMTHRATIQRAADILINQFGCSIRVHGIAPKNPLRHRRSFYFAVRRTAWLIKISEEMMRYSTTKFRNWELMREICEARIARRGVSTNGSLHRGGALQLEPYTRRECELVIEIRSLNASCNNRSMIRMGGDA